MRRGWRPSRTCNPIPLTTRRIHITRTPQPSPPELATLLQAYSKLPPRQVPLSTLLAYGSPLTADSVLSSAAYVREEIPRRLARGVRNLDALPFIVGTNPFITRIHKLYTTSFQELASFPEIQSVEENLRFSRRLEGHVNMHANDIPTMAKGYVMWNVIPVYVQKLMRFFSLLVLRNVHDTWTRLLFLHFWMLRSRAG